MGEMISFDISVPRPHSHLLQVEMRVPDLEESDEVVLRLPVWTPGSYKVRDYARHLQELEVTGGGQPVDVEKIDKSSWRVDASDCDEICVTYQVYGFEISPRFNHVDGSHAFVNPVACCLYPDERLDESVRLTVHPPQPDWELFCGLVRRGEEPGCFIARDFDELYDSPVEMGPHQYFDFEVQGVQHRCVFWSDEEVDLEAFQREVPTIVQQNAAMFGEIPYERYVFINHVVPDSWGGLEHRHSSVNIFSPDALADVEEDDDGDYDKDFANVLRLLSHEHFHAYNVKRLRPEQLGPFDYQRENYTPSLWVVEGVTSYYDTYNLLEAGVVSPKRYIELLEKRIKQLHSVPGRFVQSLEEASFDAWIKLYQRDENTPNSSVSYYLKGELAVWLLDLWIRDNTDGERTMADAVRRLYNEYVREADRGFPPQAVEEAVAAEAGADPSQVFEMLIRTASPIDWEQFLEPVGLQLCPDGGGDAWLGVKTKKRSGKRREVRFVFRDGPADEHGLYVGDELIAVDKRSVRGEDIGEVIARYSPGDTVTVDLIRRGRLIEQPVTLGEAPPDEMELKVNDERTDRQTRLLEGWLGTTQWDG